MHWRTLVPCTMLNSGCRTCSGPRTSGAGCWAGWATRPTRTGPHGCSWRRGPTYIVVEQSPALSGTAHERTAPGLNHLAFSAGTRADVDAMAGESLSHGWAELFPDKYPHAGGPGHFAAYLVNADGYEVELIAAG